MKYQCFTASGYDKGNNESETRTQPFCPHLFHFWSFEFPIVMKKNMGFRPSFVREPRFHDRVSFRPINILIELVRDGGGSSESRGQLPIMIKVRFHGLQYLACSELHNLCIGISESILLCYCVYDVYDVLQGLFVTKRRSIVLTQ